MFYTPKAETPKQSWIDEMLYRALRIANLCLILSLFSIAPTFANDYLVSAVKRNDTNELKVLMLQGVDPDSLSPDGTTALHWAAREDHLESVIALIDAGANPTPADRYGISPLYLAAVNGNNAILEVLLDAGAKANSIAPTGETTLMTAVRTGRMDAIELLLARGAKVDTREPQYQQTALMLAVREDHPDIAQLLINHGADVNARTRTTEPPEFKPPCKGTGCGSEGVGINRGGLPDRGRRDAASGGMTPLLYAARDGRTEVAQVLIEADVNLEIREANGISPILMALLNNQLSVASLLLDQGANINIQDFWGRSPLFAAVEYRNLDMNNRAEDSPTHNGVERAPVLSFIERLLVAGADANVRTKEVWPTRKWLYSLNDVSWVDFTGQTPFLRAALSADISAMEILLTYGADPHLATHAGTTPLMAAAGVNWVVAQTYTESEQAQLDTVVYCLALGADVNATNSMGLTPLLGAANRGSNDIIKLLAENGARLDVKDVEGRTARRWAEGVFLAAVGAEIKPSTIALLEELDANAATSAP